VHRLEPGGGGVMARAAAAEDRPGLKPRLINHPRAAKRSRQGAGAPPGVRWGNDTIVYLRKLRGTLARLASVKWSGILISLAEVFDSWETLRQVRCKICHHKGGLPPRWSPPCRIVPPRRDTFKTMSSVLFQLRTAAHYNPGYRQHLC